MTLVALSNAEPPFILSLDIGTSSLRAILFDAQGRELEGTRAVRSYSPCLKGDGGAELDAEEMFERLVSVLDEAVGRTAGAQISAVAGCSLASSVLGIDLDNRPLTPVYLYADTRNTRAVEELEVRVDWSPIYARTGCPLHTGCLPSRLWWLRETNAGIFEQAARWVSLHEFFLLKLFAMSIISHSLASWTGLYNRTELDWDGELLGLLGIRREQLSPLAGEGDSLCGLLPVYSSRWPALSDAPFYPAVGDGAAANVGSGCAATGTVAITVGTSGAMRAILPQAAQVLIPRGLWLYTVDERRGLLGGSLNNGGNVFTYLRRILQLPESSVLEQQLESMEPDEHGLTMLSFFAGERSPGYRGDARAVISGLSLDTLPVQIVRAAMEAIAYRFALIYKLLRQAIPEPTRIIASGTALIKSSAWVQILADVLGQSITVSGETEASARGAALLCLQAVGAIEDASDLPALSGETHPAVQAHHDNYQRAIERQNKLYGLLLGGGKDG